MALALLLAVPVGASAPLSLQGVLGSGDLDPKELEQYENSPNSAPSVGGVVLDGAKDHTSTALWQSTSCGGCSVLHPHRY